MHQAGGVRYSVHPGLSDLAIRAIAVLVVEITQFPLRRNIVGRQPAPQQRDDVHLLTGGDSPFDDSGAGPRFVISWRGNPLEAWTLPVSGFL
jgi:hypothetical protein